MASRLPARGALGVAIIGSVLSAIDRSRVDRTVVGLLNAAGPAPASPRSNTSDRARTALSSNAGRSAASS
ncbi:hypothetical protein AB0M47_15480 [Hamadaea sp. NPDC051192]|uniref:hypothetical protein n=1 Tax=Hamadaea sp. NPDC051192 TaxID=3154940 RepID=UPI00341B7DC7